MPVQEIAGGQKADLIPNKFTRESHAFIGWSTVTDPEKAPAVIIEYLNEAEYSMGSSDVSLYAVWREEGVLGSVGPSGGYIFHLEPSGDKTLFAF